MKTKTVQTFIEHTKSNAYNVRLLLNNRKRQPNDIVKQVEKQYQDCFYNPTIGLIAKHKYLKGMSDKLAVKLHNIELLKSPIIRLMKEQLEMRLDKLYPISKKARLYIVKNDRINLKTIQPSAGYTFMDKIKILFG